MDHKFTLLKVAATEYIVRFSYVKIATIAVLLFVLLPLRVVGQNSVSMSLRDAITQAQEQSIDGMVAKFEYMASYWQYRSFKARRLPSINLDASLPSFDRSLTPLQNYETGEYRYVENFVLRNQIGISIDQNIAATGGTIKLSTSLSRMDQFSPSRTATYNSAPISLIYSQPIGAFNSMKWDKLIEPEKYEMAKFTYLESMQTIAQNVVEMFFTQLISQQQVASTQLNLTNTQKAYELALKRFNIGSITKNELVQLELRVLNLQSEVQRDLLTLDLAKTNLKSYIRLPESDDLELLVPDVPQNLKVEYDRVYALSIDNTSVYYSQKIKVLEAKRDLASAKSEARPQIDLYARVGLNQASSSFLGAYRSPVDQENIQVGLRVPIFDGGVAKGRIQMAKSRQSLIDARIEKQNTDLRQDLALRVAQLNNQNGQCMITQKADSVANVFYSLSIERFALGQMSVLEFNTAQSETNSAIITYMNELKNFWNYYYNIERLTLYDFINRINLPQVFDKVMLEE